MFSLYMVHPPSARTSTSVFYPRCHAGNLNDVTTIFKCFQHIAFSLKITQKGPERRITWGYASSYLASRRSLIQLSEPHFWERSQNSEKRLLVSCMSVRPSIRREQLGYHWTDFHEIWYLSIFRKTVEKIQVSLQSENNKGYFTWRQI